MQGVPMFSTSLSIYWPHHPRSCSHWPLFPAILEVLTIIRHFCIYIFLSACTKIQHPRFPPFSAHLCNAHAQCGMNLYLRLASPNYRNKFEPRTSCSALETTHEAFSPRISAVVTWYGWIRGDVSAIMASSDKRQIVRLIVRLGCAYDRRLTVINRCIPTSHANNDQRHHRNHHGPALTTADHASYTLALASICHTSTITIHRRNSEQY